MMKRTIYNLLAILTAIALSIDTSAQAPNTWAQEANVGGGIRTEAVGFSIGSKGYIGTGETSSGLTNDFWEYDPSSNTWTQKANFGGTPDLQALVFVLITKGILVQDTIQVVTGTIFGNILPHAFYQTPQQIPHHLQIKIFVLAIQLSSVQVVPEPSDGIVQQQEEYGLEEEVLLLPLF